MYMYIIHNKIWKLIVFFTIYKVTDDNLLFFFQKDGRKLSTILEKKCCVL